MPLTAKTLKRIGIGILAAILIGTIAIMLLRGYAETYSFAPDHPDQALLAQQHAECAAVYMVLKTAACKQASPERLELETDYKTEFEHHVRMGVNFSPDKPQYRVRIENAVTAFNAAIAAASNKNEIAKLIEDRTMKCVETTVRSANFVEQILKERSAN
jgi:hypothetical protein